MVEDVVADDADCITALHVGTKTFKQFVYDNMNNMK